LRGVESGACGGPSVTSIAAKIVVELTSEGGDDPGRIDLTDKAIPSVGDIQVAACVEGNLVGAVELRASGRPSVSSIAAMTGIGRLCTRIGANDASGVNLADDVVGTVAEVQIATRVEGDAVTGTAICALVADPPSPVSPTLP
jgi:hypothetical protein